jgi:uncharacterized membrane protein
VTLTADFNPATIEALVVTLDAVDRSDSMIEELRSLHHKQVVRVIDLVVVNRDLTGRTSAHGRTELTPAEADQWHEFVSDALGFEVGNQNFEAGLHWNGRSVVLGAEDVKFVADMIGPGQSALAIVFEHCWASRLDDLIRQEGVSIVEDDVFRPGQAGLR